ncbi:hydrogenase assembly protein HupF [Caldimicrobium thiodismutans]|uniref:Hydrogenase assembly protein HupF n=1 Tax=Caldimicrobium thiodismutans TaxID=1653476 RepID=A0A0U4W3Q4_9BACT|nr:HypC/HybG/HupF family hydrogenase formation chaperone [Caldimicrobium thiodismutans]BAU23723.1 hydrogenase assembly protein HupF [Caldimicrobium thiodismutans]
MCLAYPYQILEITGPFTAKASVDGVTKEIYISLIGEPLKPGDWVLVHVGFAIQKVDETLAFETLKNYHDLFSEDSP